MAKSEIKGLEEKLEEMGWRIKKLEALVATLAKARPGTEAVNGHVATAQTIPEEIILAISAAVAAFLGKRASIRQIRLTGSTPWAQQGRATVQASHGVEFVRGLR